MAIEDVTGTAAEGGEETPAAETPAPEASATDTGETPAGDRKEEFFDPSTLSPELKAQWTRMQGAFTKRMQQAREWKDKSALVDQFRSDPTFALQTIQQAATQMGYQLSRGQAAQVAATVAADAGVPSELVEAVKARLSPELQWMAPAMAAGQWAAMQVTMKPMQDRTDAERRSQREAKYAELADQLTEAAPGWEEHEDDMNTLLDFLRSDTMTHRKFGSKLKLLHNIVTGNAAAVSEATRRMGDAARARTTSGQSGRASTSNIEDRVLKAKTTQDAWNEAAKFAIQELERHGTTIR